MEVSQPLGARHDHEWALYIPLGVSVTLELEIECPRDIGYRALERAPSLKDLRSGLVARAHVHNPGVIGRGSYKVSLEAHRIHQFDDAVFTHRLPGNRDYAAELPGSAYRLRCRCTHNRHAADHHNQQRQH